MGVTVYSTPSCPWCHKAKEFLAENDVDFKDVNVAADQSAAHEMIKKSGQMGVPVLDINGEVVVGFDMSRIKDLLNL